jgi:translation initiation factor IF-3
MTQKYYRINRQITAPTLRLLDEDGKQIDVVTLAQAFQLSSESGLDLVEIAGKAVPPVVKLIEFSKFKYQEAKKAKAEKRGIKGGETKEVQMTPFIGQGDYDTRIKKSREFLTTGNKIKLSIKFQGRQIQKPEFGYQLVERFTNDLAEISAPEGTAKLIGKRLLITFSPIKKTKK